MLSSDNRPVGRPSEFQFQFMTTKPLILICFVVTDTTTMQAPNKESRVGTTN